jgi:AcrR family transcriptional regulator
MSTKGNDRRVKYTKLMIKQALFDLMENKPLEKITVTEICALADINRGTFYKYYLDVKDLFSQLENEYFNQLVSILDQEINHVLKLKQVDFLHFRYDTLLNTIKDNKDLTRIILPSGEKSDLLKRLISYAKDDITASANLVFPDLPAEKAEYVYSYIISGSVGMITTWLESGMALSVEDLCQLIAKLNKIDLRFTVSGEGS